METGKNYYGLRSRKNCCGRFLGATTVLATAVATTMLVGTVVQLAGLTASVLSRANPSAKADHETTNAFVLQPTLSGGPVVLSLARKPMLCAVAPATYMLRALSNA